MNEFLNTLVDLVTYFANGVLEMVYWLFERAPHLTSLACAIFIMVTFDRWAQQQAVFAPGRYDGGRPAAAAQPRAAQFTTLAAIVLWLIATWTFGAPVPLIGACMWLAAALGLLMMPQQRWSMLWATKGGLILYSLAVIGYRLWLWQAARLTPAQLANVFGGAASAASVVSSNTGTVATVGAWLLWVIMPAGYIYMIIQNWIAQPMGIVNPLAGAQDVLTAIRTRGNPDAPEEI